MDKMVTSIFLFLYITVSILANCERVPIISPKLYVAPGGNDNHPGTREKPFVTLARARAAVREFKKGGA